MNYLANDIIFVFFSLFFVFLFMQPLDAKPASSQPAEQGDEYAKKAADALDSTLLSVKEGLNYLIEDSKLFGNMMSKLASDIISMAPQGKTGNTEESSQRLQEMSERANRTLTERLFKMDDD